MCGFEAQRLVNKGGERSKRDGFQMLTSGQPGDSRSLEECLEQVNPKIEVDERGC